MAEKNQNIGITLNFKIKKKFLSKILKDKNMELLTNKSENSKSTFFSKIKVNMKKLSP